MKRIQLILSVAFLLTAGIVSAQQEKTVSAIKAGTTLTDDDIGFLTMVSKATVDVSRGSATREAKIGSTTYKAGQTLTSAQAKSLNTAIANWQKTYKAPDASRGAGLCYYWYYYCNGYGWCYWYKYWYYC